MRQKKGRKESSYPSFFTEKQYTVALIILYIDTLIDTRDFCLLLYMAFDTHNDLEHHCVIDPHWNLGVWCYLKKQQHRQWHSDQVTIS